MKFARWLGSLLRWLRESRYQWLLLMTLLCFVLRENYPFSHFPMYSSFSNQTYFLYLSDAAGRPISTERFGLASSTLKKIFDRQWRSELTRFKNAGTARVSLAEAAAAESLLHYLDGLGGNQTEAKALLPGVRVEHVLIRQKADGLVLDQRTLAQHP